jgi:nucleoside-diphosphate-sugar epimerase
MAIMITGGTGFIAVPLAHRLVASGETVVLFDAQPDLRAIRNLAERADALPPHRIFNIGGDYRSRRELGEVLKTLLPEAQIEIGSEAMQGGYRSTRHQNRRIGEDLGFRTQWPLERGVRATVNWVREQAGLPPVA